MNKNDNKILTRIEQQSKDKKRFSLYINDQFWMGVSEDILVRYGLRKGMELTKDNLKKIACDEEQTKANSYALKLLSFRSRSEQELIHKMKEKQYDEESINSTLIFLKSHNYINDETFAKDFVKNKTRTKKIGKMRLKQELHSKGIPKDIISNTIEELIDQDQEYKTALEISTKKLETSYRNDDIQSQYRKLGAFLQRRGFEYEIISKVLNKLLKG